MASWWVDHLIDDLNRLDTIDWPKLGITHLLVDSATGEDPLSYGSSGLVTCNESKARFQRIVATGRAHDFKVMVLGSASMSQLSKNASYVSGYWANLVKTLGPAAKECGARGVEFDFEPDYEPTAAQRTQFTYQLGVLNTATDPDFEVVLDLVMWGITGDDFPLDWRPYIDEKLLNSGRGPSFINTESYHWPEFYSNINAYKRDGAWLDFFGVNRSRVNIGLPTFSHPTKAHCSKPYNLKDCNNTWEWLSKECPNIKNNSIDCDGDHVVSKEMARDLGEWIVKQGFGGAFPWALSYDALDKSCSKSLTALLAEGMGIQVN